MLGEGQREGHTYTWRDKLGHTGKGLANCTKEFKIMS